MVETISSFRRMPLVRGPRSVRLVEDDAPPTVRSRRATWGDVAVAAITWLLGLSTATFAGMKDGEPRMTLAAAGVLAAGALPLCWRRTRPVAVWVAVGAVAAVYGAADWPDPLLPFAPLLALVSVFERCPTRTRAVVWVITAATAIAVTAWARDADALDWWTTAFVVIAGPLAGDYLRKRRVLIEQSQARSRRLEVERVQAIDDARAAERARVARELHDVVAHHVTMLVVQAEAAASQHTDAGSAPDPTQTQATFDELARSGRTAMNELRQLLGALRHGTDPAPITPQPSLADLDELLAGIRASNVQVTADIDPATTSLPTATGLAAYRIVQEGLTNVVKHAPGAGAHVELHVIGHELAITITNDSPRTGPTRSPSSTAQPAGMGLIGLRERVQLLGGTLDTTILPHGGFRLAAHLPLETR